MLLRSCDSVFTNVDLLLRKLIMFYPKVINVLVYTSAIFQKTLLNDSMKY